MMHSISRSQPAPQGPIMRINFVCKTWDHLAGTALSCPWDCLQRATADAIMLFNKIAKTLLELRGSTLYGPLFIASYLSDLSSAYTHISVQFILFISIIGLCGVCCRLYYTARYSKRSYRLYN
jgi:hypothetical protein